MSVNPHDLTAGFPRADRPRVSRRDMLRTSFGTAAAVVAAESLGATPSPPAAKALVSITLDLEMCDNFPRWEDKHWSYEKGNLNDETKAYAVEACRRIKRHGGIAHLFVVGRALEQANVDWLKQIVQEGHRLGNHTYDHVYVLAQKPEEIQFRFRRSPWLIEGRSPADVIRENIRLTSEAIRTRIGVEPDGFRAPGGFAMGLANRTDVQQLLLDSGFRWASTQSPSPSMGSAAMQPTAVIYERIVAAQRAAQPFVYPSGLIEVPMSPVSDVGAFRGGRWKLPWYLEQIRRGLTECIARGWTYDFLCHPSVLYSQDAGFEAIELMCEIVSSSKGRAELVDLNALAKYAAKGTTKH